MGKHKPARTDGSSADALVKRGGKAEKRLLRLERRAERSLTEARAKLRKAQTRLERRLSAVSDAEALLRTRQAARAAGPNGSNGTSLETLPPAGAGTSDLIVGASDAAPSDSPIVVLDGKAPDAPAAEIESAAELVLPPATKAPARRRTTRSAAPKEPAP